MMTLIALTAGIIIIIETTMRNNYLKRNYVINTDYVLHIYPLKKSENAVLFSIALSNLESSKNFISKLMN